MSEELAELRKQLDKLDRRLVDGLAERQSIVASVASVKAGGSGALRDTIREEDLLTELARYAQERGVDGFYVTRIFQEILEHSVRVQQAHLTAVDNPSLAAVDTVTVAYQGGLGSYSHEAASRHFGARSEPVIYRGFDSFEAMLDAVAGGKTQYAILPLENTTAGSINESYDLLARMNLSLVAEEVQRVDHCLVGFEDVPLGTLRRVYSHPQALAQCSDFLGSLESCRLEAFSDTALAVGRIKDDGDPSQAAIASEAAARRYQLPVLRRGIANQKDNFTRMVIVAKEPVHYDRRIPCKTSLILVARHEPGALSKCLEILDEHGLNLTKLESRPRPNSPWEYLFYVDFEGNCADEKVKDALRKLAALTNFVTVLGSYPSQTAKAARPAEPRLAAGSRPAVTAVTAAAAEPSEGGSSQPYRLASRANRKEDTHVCIGPVTVGAKEAIVIAGPCAVETPEQIRACARVVKENGGSLLRGGCFKPRTSPYSFQGLGYEGLDLLEKAGREFGLPIVTEVVEPDDVEKVARQSDVLQIGARNMQNYALLKQVGKVDRAVLLKRGLTATIDEWLLAAEYVLAHGNQQVILCERGIRTFEPATRNTLDLSAVPVIRERTHLPIIVDPSHAVGVRRWIPPLAQAAFAVGAHGIMVEIHPDPKTALSDGPQALRFEDFGRLMQDLRG